MATVLEFDRIRPVLCGSARPPLDRWIAAVAGGDSTALGRLYDATCQDVFSLAQRIVRDSQVAEEVTTDVYVQVWRRASTYARERGSALGWLLTMTRSRSIDRIRTESARRRDETELGAGDERAGSRVGEDGSEAGDLVRAALDLLPAAQREALLLVYDQGLSQRQAAVRLGEPVGTIKTRIRLGLGRLRDVLRPLEER